MTTIAAYRHGDSVALGSDTASSTSIILPAHRGKIMGHASASGLHWRWGSTGSLSVIQAVNIALARALDPVTRADELPAALSGLTRALKNEWGLMTEQGADELQQLHIQMLLASALGLFYVSEDRAVIEIDPDEGMAIGSGGMIALGAMYGSRQRICDEKLDSISAAIVIAGLAVASRFDPYTQGLDVVHVVQVTRPSTGA